MQKSIARDMSITVNGERMGTSARTLAELVAALGHDAASIATAVNGEFVARKAREECGLAEGDAVEIVAPRQGG